MESTESLKLLGLSKKELKVLTALQEGADTPVKLTKATDVSRTAIYAILQNLKKRGIVVSHIKNGKKTFILADEREIEEVLYAAKRTLLKIPEGREEIMGLSDSTVIVHRGKDAVLEALLSITKHKHERLYGLQGNTVQQGWDSIVGPEKINEFNHDLRKNDVITEAILPYEWFEDHIQDLGHKEGLKWAKGFIGRAYATYLIDKKYFEHAGQIFMFKDSLYMMAMNEALVVEIRNSELQKMIKQMFSFIEEYAEKVDVNTRLREIIERMEHEKE